jgi:predicted SAM-dependent methyltransferase
MSKGRVIGMPRAQAKVRRNGTGTNGRGSHGGSVLTEAAGRSVCKLDLGCGQNPKEGFEGVDIRGGKAKHIVDLFSFPWPFEDESVDEIHCSHFLEHVPSREVGELDISGAPHHEITKEARGRWIGQDMLFAFMDECWRILKPEGWMHVIVPSGRSNRAFQDPTHRRFFVQETFLYFNAEWRKQNGLDHYRARCHFGFDVNHTLPTEETLRSPEAQTMRFMHFWNVTVDWVAKLKKLPLLAATAAASAKAEV